MNLRRVYIYSHQTAQEAEDKINSAINEIDSEEVGINYELKIENTVQILSGLETYYTLIIQEYAIPIIDILGEGEPYADD